MVRASVEAERAGIPSVSIVASAFLGQASVVAKGLGVSDLPTAEYPGVIATDSTESFREKVVALTNDLTEAFTQPLRLAVRETPPARKDIVIRGTLDQVQDHFESNLLTDGLPIVPPTTDRIEAFLQHTNLSLIHISEPTRPY